MALPSVKCVPILYAERVTEPGALSLADAKRQAVVDLVLASARQLVLRSGLDVTMDQLAEACQVSRRTLFRLFASRDNLLAAAFDAGMANYRDGLPRYSGDLSAWLRATCDAAHRMNSTIGPGFFELASRPDLPAELAAAEGRRRAAFAAAIADIAGTLWSAAGGRGRAPRRLTNIVSAHLSPFFTAAMTVDTGQSWQVSADLAYFAIEAATAQALQGARTSDTANDTRSAR
jgi:AcrR family transcriptional regulator